MSQTFELDYTLTRNDEDLDVIVEYTLSKWYPAQTYGLPENCYPEEGGEIEELTVWHDGNELIITGHEEQEIERFIYSTHEYGVDYN